MRLLVFGLGYSASAAIRRLEGRCAWVGGTTRSPEKAAEMAAMGISPFLFNGGDRDAALAEAVRASSHVLVSIAPTADAGMMASGHVDPALAAFARDLVAPLADGTRRSIVYLSTIGVYGDAGGRWVDEDTPCRPDAPRAQARRIAEDAWLALGKDEPVGAPPIVSVLRLSGIYGPGRNTFLNLAAGTARRLVKPGQVFNRIHVEDIAQAVDRSFERRATGIFNITDDEPAPPQDVVEFAASLMGIEPPPVQDFATAELSPMARSFYGANKRVSNARSKNVLAMRYEYPDYRAALTRMWTEETWRPDT